MLRYDTSREHRSENMLLCQAFPVPIERSACILMKLPLAVLVLVVTWSSMSGAAAQQKSEARSIDGWKSSSRSAASSSLRADSDQPCTDGQAGAFPCSNIDLMAFMPIDSIGGRRSFDGKPLTALNDIWGWTDPETGKEYAIVGRTDGTSFVDITDPQKPIYLGNLPSHNDQYSTWRDVKTIDHYALIVMDLTPTALHGMQVFDLHELRSVGDSPAAFSETAHFAGFEQAHNIVVNAESKYAYAVGTRECPGLYMIDVENPIEPEYSGCFADGRTGRRGDGYTHDAQCVIYHGPDSEYTGQEICFAANETHVLIADLSNKSAPKTISFAEYPANAYAHQGWLTEDHRYFLQDDELDELRAGIQNTRTLIWDVTELGDPILAGTYLAETRSIDHNQYTRGNRVFQSNYTSGLRILDITDPAHPEEVGFFDTFPAHDSAEFSGAWSNYPYFESGNVVVSSIDEGLFVVRSTLGADVSAEDDELPDGFALLPSYPNPFNPQSTIALRVDQPQHVRVAVFDARGKEVAELFSGFVDEPGRKEFIFAADGLSSGVYFVRAFGASGNRTTAVTLQK